MRAGNTNERESTLTRGCQCSIYHRVFFVANLMRWQITSGSANLNQATLTTPKHANITKNYVGPFFLERTRRT